MRRVVPLSPRRQFGDRLPRRPAESVNPKDPGCVLRSLFFSIGVSVALWGGMLFHVESITLQGGTPAELRPVIAAVSQPAGGGKRVIDPPDWLPYTLLTAGVLTTLYSVALPRK